MKKTSQILLSLLLTTMLVSCGNNSTNQPTSTDTGTADTNTVTDTNTDTETKETFMSVSEAKNAADKSEVTVKATVITKTDVGFYLKDESGYIYTYIGTGKEELLNSISVGSLVKVTGYAATYNLSHQISYRTNDDETVDDVQIEVVNEGSGTYDVQYEDCSVYDVYDFDNLDLSVYAKPVRIRGYIEYVNGDYNNPYGVVDDNGNKVYLNKYPLNNIVFSEVQHNYVSLEGFVYCYVSNSFSLIASAVNSLSAEDVSDEQAVKAAEHYLSTSFNGSKTTDNIELVTTYLGAAITYTSKNEAVIESNGTYHKPSEATDVEFDVTITRGEFTKTITCKVTALSITTPHLVISEMFSGGGNSKAAYATDFIELYNQTDEDIDLSEYSLQNASTGKTGSFAVHELSGIIKAHDYFLIRGGSSASDPTLFPTLEEYDLEVPAFNPAASSYLVALAKGTTKIEFTYNAEGSTLTSNNVVDLLGAGSAATLFEGEKISYSGNDKSLQRKDPEVDTDNNKNDFVFATPTPTKSSNN